MRLFKLNTLDTNLKYFYSKTKIEKLPNIEFGSFF